MEAVFKANNVTIVKRVSANNAACKRTSGHIQVTSHTRVGIVENVSVRIMDYRGTPGYLQETNPNKCEHCVSTVENVSVSTAN